MTKTISYHIYACALWFVWCCKLLPKTSLLHTSSHSSLIHSGNPRTKSSSKHARVLYIWRSSKTEDSLPSSLHNSQQLHVSFSRLSWWQGTTTCQFFQAQSCTEKLSHTVVRDLTLLPMWDQNISHTVLHENNVIRNILQSHCVCQSQQYSYVETTNL